MIKRFALTNNQRLAVIIDAIEQSLRCTKYQSYRQLIGVDTVGNFTFYSPDNRKTAERGFGCLIPNYREYGQIKPIIVMNMDNCRCADFTDDDITAVIYHELGHLLNVPPPVHVPTFLYCFENAIQYSRHAEEEALTQNYMQAEIFADAYAVRHGYGAALISTLQKQNQFFVQQVEYMDIRVEKIKSEESFEGITLSNNILL